jgi:hypothetical protein
MTIDWDIAVVNTLKKGRFPNREKVWDSLRFIENRVAVSLQYIHGYCYYTKKNVKDNSDLDGIEECMIEIINSATYVLKETRKLKNKRSGKT